jgi:NitT/TauT family transport system ATP-binding protein
LLVLEGMNLELVEGQIVGLLGRSGSGKSTLLRLIAGLSEPSAGHLSYLGQPIFGPAAGIAMVFQSFALFPWLTVFENVAIGLEAQRMARPEIRKRTLAAIDLIGLDGFESAYPRELSGGMRQRVGFARALVVHPNILLMDEPFSALDVLTAETLRTDFLDLWAEGRMPIKGVILVTHNIEEAVLMCDRVLVFGSNPGRILSEIKVTLPQPRNRLDPSFRELVERIYVEMTARPNGRRRAAGRNAFPGSASAACCRTWVLEPAGRLPGGGGGPPFNGKADLPKSPRICRWRSTSCFRSPKPCRCCASPNSRAAISNSPRTALAFAHADIDERKRIFRATCWTYVPLAAHIRRVLDERASHSGAQEPFHRRARRLHERGSRGFDLARRGELGPLRGGVCLRRRECHVQPRESDLEWLAMTDYGPRPT